MNTFTKFIYCAILLSISIFEVSAFNSVERIPEANIRMPGHDIVIPGNEDWGPERLYQESTKEKNPLDLSLFDPVESEVWKNKLGEQLNFSHDFLPLEENPVVSFSGHLTSAPEQMRFNVLSSSDKEFYTIVLEKSLHTMLMRKNLLRQLGYVIPKTDYRRTIQVRFANLEEMNDFRKVLPQATLGAASRWIKKRDDKSFTLTLQDVALMKPSEKDHFNFAMGVVPKTHVQRTIRSLVIPYALLNVKESINQVTWNVGRYDNEHFILPHFAFGNLNASLDDVKWALRRLAKLTREDLAQVVKYSYYPIAVETLLIEKIIARRNSLLKLFNIEHTPYKFNLEKSYKDTMVKGRIIKQDWEGYASRFAFGNPESPFDDVQSNILSEAQQEAFSYATGRLAEKLIAYDLNEARSAYFEEQFRVGLEHFVETGEIIEFGIGAWWTPVLNGNLILNRSIVLGSYLGSDNIVQLADTFGFAVEAGMHVGFEDLPENLSGAFARGGVNYLKTFTHLKPVNSLKQSLKEPYKNIYVPLVKKMLRTTTAELAELTEKINDQQKEGEEFKGLNEAQQEQFETLFSQINEFLGVGESLIVTRKIIPGIQAGITAGDITAALSFATGVDAQFIKRLHVYRNSESEIQVYNDVGRTAGYSFSFSLGSNGANILRFNKGGTKGRYDVEFHKLNISTDIENNRNFSLQAAALSKLLKDGDNDLLNEVAPPHKVRGNFGESIRRAKLLFYTNQNVKASNIIKLKDPENFDSQYLTIDRQKQSGYNFQLFITELINFWLREKGKDFSFSTQTYENPSFTFFGSADSVKSRFEARFDKNVVKNPFISITSTNQGWKIKKNRLRNKLKALNRKYGRTLFNDNTLADIESMRVYDISVNLNLYEKGIDAISKITVKQLDSVANKLTRDIDCRNEDDQDKKLRCAKNKLSSIYRVRRKCSKNDLSESRKSSCLLELATVLKEDMKFDYLSDLIGEDNYYLYGSVSGFRTGSEILYEPARSNGFGKIGSRFVQGPVQELIRLIGIQGGEFNGSWIRTLL